MAGRYPAEDGLPRAEVPWHPEAVLAHAIDAATHADWPAAQALAAISQAMALQQPTPEEVMAVVNAEEVDALARLRRVEEVLETSLKRGPRHPAIHAALEVIRE